MIDIYRKGWVLVSKEKTSINFDGAILKELRKEAEKRNVHLYDVVNDACRFYLEQKNKSEIDSIYAPRVEQTIQVHFKNLENRLANLLAKNSLDSATTLFMFLQFLSIETGMDAEEIYTRSRKMGVKHVQNRDELLNMLKEKLDGSQE